MRSIHRKLLACLMAVSLLFGVAAVQAAVSPGLTVKTTQQDLPAQDLAAPASRSAAPVQPALIGAGSPMPRPAPEGPKPGPVQIHTTGAPAPAPLAAAGAAESTASAPAPQPARAPELTVNSMDIGTAITRNGYTLTLTQDAFPTGTAIAATATLTRFGYPISSALIWVGDSGSPVVTTNSAGQAAIELPAQDHSMEIPLRVQYDQDLGYLGMLFVYGPEHGVLIIDRYDDQNNEPIFEYEALFYAGQSVWHRHTRHGAVGMVLPPGCGFLEVAGHPQDAPSLLVTGSWCVQAGVVQRYHPSGSGTSPVHIAPTLDGAPLQGKVSLHSSAKGGTTFDQHLTNDIWVSPGTYSLLFTGEVNDQNLVLSGPTFTVPEGTRTWCFPAPPLPCRRARRVRPRTCRLRWSVRRCRESPSPAPTSAESP